MPGNAGRRLLLMASQHVQTIAQLIDNSDLTPADILHQVQHLVDQGFMVADVGDTGPTVYRLTSKAAGLEALDGHQRILVIDDNADLQRVTTSILEDDGYVVMTLSTPAEAATLLDEVAFDLVITDGFSQSASAVLVNAAELLSAAGTTPVVLFTAHHVELDAARAAGFRAVIDKPFDVDRMLEQIRTPLQDVS